MSAALIERQDRLEETAATATVATFAAGVALSLLALTLSPIVRFYFHSQDVGLVAAALSGRLLLNAAVVVPDALLLRRFSFLRTNVVDPSTRSATAQSQHCSRAWRTRRRSWKSRGGFATSTKPQHLMISHPLSPKIVTALPWREASRQRTSLLPAS